MKSIPYLFTSESVSKGHRETLVDQISDGLIDNFLSFNSQSKITYETLATKVQIVLSGEVKSKAFLDFQTIARNANKKTRYTNNEYMFNEDSFGILSAILINTSLHLILVNLTI